ncbi:MAG: hypothetical protein K2H41_12555 [Acetatifactor sp.]|nr:hypothetical protein [Acetatifactor sp.]
MLPPVVIGVAIWRKQLLFLTDGEHRAVEKEGWTEEISGGRNVCRLKGGWLLQASSPGKRRPVRPSGKERCHPEIRGTAKLGGIEKESAGNTVFVWGHGCDFLNIIKISVMN